MLNYKSKRDGSNTISFNEMSRVFEVIKISDKEKLAILNEMERLGKSGINFDDFSRVIGPKYFRKYTPKELQEAFWYFDKGKKNFNILK